MKLIRLQINEPFRSLQSGFDITFRDPDVNKELAEFHPFCLAGLNGSGKSNVLEALANIFYHLECCVNNYPEYAYKKEESQPDAYILEYFIAVNPKITKPEEMSKVKIIKEKGKSPLVNINDDEKSFEITNGGKTYLPDLVVAYSSGENETLSLPFVKMRLFQYDEYLKDFSKGTEYNKPVSSLLYIDYEMSQAVLLTILLFLDDNVLQPIRGIEEGDLGLGIQKIQKFRLNFYNRKIDEKEDSLLEHLSTQIQKLKNCATCFFEDGFYSSLDFWVNDATKDAIKANFEGGAYEFFSVFQMLHALNNRTDSEEEKKDIYSSKGFYTDYKRSEEAGVFHFSDYFLTKKNKGKGQPNSLLLKQLSDGEQQFLHTLGICLMLQNKRTLLLLDEPETHFNPDWRSKFINVLRKTLQAGGDNFMLKDIVLTSHSPFIISDCLPDKVIIFEKGEAGVTAISSHEKHFNTYGTAVSMILEEIFKKKETIPYESLSTLREIENRSLISLEDVKKAKEDSRKLGESPEKVLLFRKLIIRENEIKNS